MQYVWRWGGRGLDQFFALLLSEVSYCLSGAAQGGLWDARYIGARFLTGTNWQSATTVHGAASFYSSCQPDLSCLVHKPAATLRYSFWVLNIDCLIYWGMGHNPHLMTGFQMLFWWSLTIQICRKDSFLSLYASCHWSPLQLLGRRGKGRQTAYHAFFTKGDVVHPNRGRSSIFLHVTFPPHSWQAHTT